MPRRIVMAVVAALGCASLLAAQAPRQSPQVLRAGAFLVQVDAYPLKDGEPIRGLTAGDFVLLEDGKPQTIDSVRFLEYPLWTPDQMRRDPNSQRESFDLAGDPANRLFVVYLNRMAWQHGNLVEPALFEFLDRSMGPRDYVAVMTQMQGPGDIVFGQLSAAFKSEITRFLNIVDHLDPRYLDPAELELLTCFPGPEGEGLIRRWRADDVYRDLEGVTTLLGSIRETRSTLVFVSETMTDPDAARPAAPSSVRPRLLPPGQQMPPPGGRGSFALPGRMIENTRCENLKRAATEPWPADRFKKLLASARAANVALTPINPRGLVASANLDEIDAAERANDLMRTMASETGGRAIVNLNSMQEGFRRVAEELTSHYVLGYYSSNTNADGRVRRLTVKLTSNGETIPARREYRAPAAADAAPSAVPAPSGAVAAAAMPGLQQALWDLERDDREAEDPARQRRVDPALPRLFRAASPPAAPWQPVTRRRFSRTERLRLEWAGPSAPGPSGLTVRILTQDGRPLPVPADIAVSGSTTVTADLRLAPLAAGIYVIEATWPSGATQHIAFRIS